MLRSQVEALDEECMPPPARDLAVLVEALDLPLKSRAGSQCGARSSCGGWVLS